MHRRTSGLPRALSCLILILSTMVQGIQHAEAADPLIPWKVLETPHFTIVYDSRQQPVGEAYAKFAEQSFAAIAPTFGVWPEKTVLIVDDSTDESNGSASPWPYPTIIAYPVLPSALEAIGDYGDWGLELVLHEYVHILNFEPATGLMRPLRWVFGSVVRPNVLLPRWYSEGLAVELETRYSRHGRLRSPTYLAIARAMVEENTLRNEDIARINETIPDWPGGNRPYLLGALMWNELTRRGGDKIIGDLNMAYSKRIPFLINGPVESRLGLDYSALLGEVYTRIEKESKAQIDAIEKAGRTAELPFPKEGLFSHSPVISPDGLKLVSVAREHNIDSYVRFAERAPGETMSFREKPGRKLVEGESIQKISWLPDSSGFVYDSLGTFERHYERSDLYKFNLAEDKATRLTRGMRARDPVVSPDGKWIVFVEITPASTRLSRVTIEGKDHKVLHEPPLQTRVSRPEFISDNEIVFGERRDDGIEVLKRVRVNADVSALEGEATTILREYAPAHFPRMTSDGLIFISDKTGVANIYLASQDLTQANALTNTTTRILTGERDSTTGELIYSRLTSTGPSLYATPSSPSSDGVTPPLVTPLVEDTWPKQEKPKPEYTAEEKEYNSLPYMVPRYWFPYAFLIPEGAYIQASTSANDPIGRHAYALTAAYDSLTTRPSFVGQYVNRTTPVTLALTGQDVNEFIYSGDLTRHTTSGSLAGSFFLPKLSNNWKGTLGWNYLQTDVLNDVLVRNGASAGISWSNAKQRGQEISPEKGGAFSLTHTSYLPKLGTIDYDQTDIAGAFYFSKFLKERHAIALFTNASIAPRLNRSILGRSTVAGSYQSAMVQTGLVMRGYRSGVFLGRNIISTTGEYRFPLSYTYSGFGTTPLFLRRVHGSVFVDSVTLDGIAFDNLAKSYRSEKLGTFYMGTGFEVKVDATIFYHVPAQFIFGMYYGFEDRLNPDGAFPFIGIGI